MDPNYLQFSLDKNNFHTMVLVTSESIIAILQLC